jgi:hypothetical protein
MVLNRNAKKTKFRQPDRLLWVFLRAVWARWDKALVIIQPQTVVGWHRAGFRLYGRWKSRGGGRPPILTDSEAASPRHRQQFDLELFSRCLILDRNSKTGFVTRHNGATKNLHR